jgi:membrane-bound metal-dependent hydrolase YbcI (DUF457 family)
MDPLTHIVIGRAVVAAARDERRNRLIGAAAILGALAPDADSALAFAGWDRYVRAHQSGTHSLLGALAMAGLAAVVVDRSAKAFAVRRDATSSAKASAERFPTLFIAAAAGAMSHLALDLLSGARIAVGWPLVDRRVSLPLVAMADPWLVAMSLAWLLLLWPARIDLRRASRALVAAAAIFFCAKGTLLATAIHRSQINRQAPSAFEARWGSLTDWFVFERLAGEVRASRIATDGGAVVTIRRPLAPVSALVSASRRLDDVENFLAVHEFAFPDEIHNGDGHISVFWSDLRYCWAAARGEPWQPATNCGVHVGGVFDASGRAMTQEIRIGGFVQTRAP